MTGSTTLENMTRRQKLRFKALCQQDMGKERLGAVVAMGNAQSPGANQGSSVGNIERCCFGSKQWSGRRTQQPNQDDQGA